MAIKKVKLPNNTTEDINDPRLPAVTTTDNGKVLSVIGGLWAKRVSSDFVHTSGNETIAGTKTFTSDVEISDIISTENGDNYPEGFDWIQDYNGSSLQDALDAKSGVVLNGTDASGSTASFYAPTSAGTSSQVLLSSGTGAPTWSAQSNITAGQCNVTSDATNSLTVMGISGTVGYSSLRRDPSIVVQGPTASLVGSSDSPKATLTLRGTSPSELYIHTSTSNGSGGFIQFGHYTQNGFKISSDYSAYASRQSLVFYRSNNTTSPFTFTPLEILRLGYEGTSAFTGDVTATGTITPGSDERIKDNKKNISTEEAFYVLDRLNPKTWTWNEKSNENLNGKSAAGLVAQEVKEILPDAVVISESGDIKDFHSLNYNTIQGYEIAAIKGLMDEVKALRAEIAELKKQTK